jgi:hypothetical protein
MRALFLGALVLSALPAACNQDSASSNSERDTHMGDIRAVAPAASGAVLESKPGAAPNAPAAPAADPMPTPPGAGDAPTKEKP